MSKKILTALLALILMVSASATTAFAADPTLTPNSQNGNTNITAAAGQLDPTYIITIPATIDFGTLTRMEVSATDAAAISEKTFNVTASDVQNLFDGDKVVVRVNASSLNLSTPGATLPFSAFKTGNATALTGATALFAEFTANGSQGGKVTIDQRQITKAGAYSGTLTFTIEVKALDPIQVLVNSKNVGDTFTASGIEWKILMKENDAALVMATERIGSVLGTKFHSSNTVFPNWSASDMRAYLNGTNTNTGTNVGIYNNNGFFQTLSSDFQALVKDTELKTRIARYDSGNGSNSTLSPDCYETTTDKVFLFSVEEAFYAGVDNIGVGSAYATTDVAAVRTNGNTVIFADNAARTCSSGNWWLRSPGIAVNQYKGAYVSFSLGTFDTTTLDSTVGPGPRPALWLKLK